MGKRKSKNDVRKIKAENSDAKAYRGYGTSAVNQARWRMQTVS